MALYEHVFLARQDISQPQLDQLIESYKALIAKEGGNIVNVENWGIRTLAYRINKNKKAYYTLFKIDAPAEAIFQLERQMRINEDVLRYMTIRVEEHEKGPSVMLARREKEERFNKNESEGK